MRLTLALGWLTLGLTGCGYFASRTPDAPVTAKTNSAPTQPEHARSAALLAIRA